MNIKISPPCYPIREAWARANVLSGHHLRVVTRDSDAVLYKLREAIQAQDSEGNTTYYHPEPVYQIWIGDNRVFVSTGWGITKNKWEQLRKARV